ncbi:radical SAM protein [Spirillospora sp. NPDC048911]|uniref:radical SAM protein n=1 Tax=Spirillospora sp. NPDC048911 TaxID=3364527 RepID=UPI0037238C82
MHHLVASPTSGDHVVLRPGSPKALRIGASRFKDLSTAVECPAWLVEAGRNLWGLNLAQVPLSGTVLVREPQPYGWIRATHEVNLGCNYDCEHCYLATKQFSGMELDDRMRMLQILQDAGVLWFQITGGEPLVDRYFREVYTKAWDLGMIISILSNGSRLHDQRILELLDARKPQTITISVYGASETTYNALTRTRGAWNTFIKGIQAAREAGLCLRASLIVTKHNAHELDEMRGLAERWFESYDEYPIMGPTIYGGPESMFSQSYEHLRSRKPFTGCNAGTTFFHVDPHGHASLCKIGRDPYVDILTEGVEGLKRLNQIADVELQRAGACTGCGIQASCGVCPPQVKLYRQSKAPLATYCQHGKDREEVVRWLL